MDRWKRKGNKPLRCKVKVYNVGYLCEKLREHAAIAMVLQINKQHYLKIKYSLMWNVINAVHFGV